MKKYITTGAICFVVGFIASKYFSKPETKIEKVEVIKIKENIRFVKETRPDGTVIETKENITEKDNTTTVKKENKAHNKWIVSVKKDLLHDTEWTGEIGRAIFRDVYVTGYYRTSGVAGVGLTITF